MISISVFIALSILGLSEAATWPDGRYCLPMPSSKLCPLGWEKGERYHDMEDDEGSKYCSIKRYGEVPYNFKLCRNLGWGFCCKTKANSPPTGKTWPIGAYCIFRKGGFCPTGFTDGYLHWDDEDCNNQNKRSGVLPDGEYGRNTRIHFCCRNDGPRKLNKLFGLPKISKLILMRYNGSCPSSVSGYSRPHSGYLQWDTEDSNNIDKRVGVFPDGAKTFGSGIKIEFCTYTLSKNASLPIWQL